VFLSIFALSDIVVAQTGHLMGRVRDEQGAAVEGALARVVSLSTDEIVALASTDDLGFFELMELPGDLIRLEVQRLGFMTYSQEFQLGDSETRTIDVELQV